MDVVSYLLGKNSGGGGPTIPTTIEEANAHITSAFNDYLNYINTTYLTNKQADTSENITLYTPDSQCKFYVIRKKDGKYNIVWLNTCFLINRGNLSGSFVKGTLSNDYMSANVIADKLEVGAGANVYMSTSSTGQVGYYSSNNYDTIEDAINAMKNNQTQYTTASSSSFSNSGLVNSNAIFMQNDSPSYVFREINKISSNEIIEVIS